MINPYFCYALAFAVSLVLYPLGWSDLYPPLSMPVVFFFGSTIGLHLVLGIYFARRKMVIFRKLHVPAWKLAPMYITIFIYLLWIAEFLYAGTIPLLGILLRTTYDYRTFGIPSVHVLVVTFSSFYTIFLFHQYLSNRSQKTLTLWLVNLAAAILIYNRGMFLFNLSACVLLYLIYKGKFSFRHVALISAGILVVSYLFGVMGTLRVSNESRGAYTNYHFLLTGRASESFRNSIIPSEFFWTYVYATSPMANVEQNVRFGTVDEVTPSAFLRWINNELLFDFVSKRVNRVTGSDRVRIATIPGPFNAPTVYSGSFRYLGFPGLLLMAVAIICLPLMYFKAIAPSSPFFLTGLATLNTIFLFMVFDNTIRFTGFSFQMVYPLLLNLGLARFEWIKKTFSF